MNLSAQRYEFLSLSITCKTWNRDSHGLYDYEAQNTEATCLETACYETKTSGCVSREGNQAIFRTETTATFPGDLLTVECGETANSRFILRQKPIGAEGDIWLVVRYMEPKGQVLTKDLVIKLGRVRYRVRELVADDLQVSESDTASSEEETRNEECIDVSCRICYEQEIERRNPLLSYCKCDGSVKFVHLQCLKKWLNSKVVLHLSESAMTYQWKSLECEICKTELPLTVSSRGAMYNLFDFEKPQNPYIVLEGVPSERSAAKLIHVISLGDKTSVKLGRGHDSDVRINDISVSRCHAVVRLEDGLFRLEDNSSKFGTLVKLASDMEITEKTVVQVGRTLLTLDPRDRSRFLSSDFRLVPSSELSFSRSL